MFPGSSEYVISYSRTTEEVQKLLDNPYVDGVVVARGDGALLMSRLYATLKGMLPYLGTLLPTGAKMEGAQDSWFIELNTVSEPSSSAVDKALGFFAKDPSNFRVEDPESLLNE